MIYRLQDTHVLLLKFSSLVVVAALSVFSHDGASGQQVPSANLGKGINFGDMLESPHEGDWGLTVQPEFFARVDEAGFDHIRIPVGWTYHAQTKAPYRVDPKFFKRIDEVLAMAEAINIKVILNDHNHDSLHADPIGERIRFMAIWDQIATRYAGRGEWLLFEILNEPHGRFTKKPSWWNKLQAETLDVIRSTNPTRKVLIAPVQFNSIDFLDQLKIPDDPNLIASIHYYAPFHFTHQGASWLDPVPSLGVKWRPSFQVLANPWKDYSWDTKVESARSGLRITYKKGWGGFLMHRDSPVVNPQAIRFRVNRPYRLQVVVFDGDERIEYPVQSTATSNDEKTYVVPFNNLPRGFELRDIAIQNYTSKSKTPMTISLLQMKQNDVWSYVMTTQENVQRLDFNVARDWAIENNIPLHLSEFGALKTGALEDRVNWTRSVRKTADVLGIDWAYWELAASNFGVYDPVKHVWRMELRRALLPRRK